MTAATAGGATVILCDRIRMLRRLAPRLAGPVRVLRLDYSEEIEAIRKELCARPETEEISRQALCREHEEEFRRAFVAFMARLNEQQHAFAWTVMPFTSKNPLSSAFLHNVFYCVLIARLLARGPQTLFVLTADRSLALQVAAWGAGAGVRVVAAVRGPSVSRRLLKHYLPTAIVVACVRTLVVAAIARRLRSRVDAGESCVVVVTTMPQSAVGPSGYREAYFAPLLRVLAASGTKTITFALIFARPVSTAWRLRQVSAPVPVIPAEAWLSFRDIVGGAIRSLRQWGRMPRLDAPTTVCGIDVRPLLHAVIGDTYRSSSFFRHLAAYHAARRLTRARQVAGWIYPFENRAMERALLLGVREGDSRASLIGCQNAALTRSHLNFMLGEREAQIIPLPDLLFTTGTPVRDWLIAEGNFAADRVRLGCALRQNRPTETSVPTKPERLRRVLVVLASSVAEYVEMLMFVAETFRDAQREIRVRPHPEFPLASALRLMSLPADFVYQASSGPLTDDFAWADVVLYASSTASMEAVVRGIPVIHVDVGHALNADPLFGRTSGLRWAVRCPADMSGCLNEIESLSQADYEQRLRIDRTYVDAYLVPADEQCIHTLVKAVRCQG